MEIPYFGEDFRVKSKIDNELLYGSKVTTSIKISSLAAAKAVMIGSDYFRPLTGFHDIEDAISICEKMQMKNNLFWPIPLLNIIDNIQGLEAGMIVNLIDPNFQDGRILGKQLIGSIHKITQKEKAKISESVFGTKDNSHPGVSMFNKMGNFLISGELAIDNHSYYSKEFPETFMTATEIRARFAHYGFKRVVAFQTRNPMHRAHEELCKIAMEETQSDALLIHMLLGKLKQGDIPASVRDQAIRVMVEKYFDQNKVMVSGYGFDMLYAGPKEALLHAIIRQNCGCSFLIIGRDHAGVGNFYEAFEAQEIFHSDLVQEFLKIKIFEADHTAYSKKLGRIIMMKDAQNHKPEDFMILSGTKVRSILEEGNDLPPEFARPEVAAVLGAYYKEKKS
ncbi:MAG: sulfate adenylyltransferase [Rhodobacteraceae bacterium]|nr:sulfate adenylyltransferase [Paracoccaceae bacterium]|tara:strand:+ start:465 stop:1643 length:1179 start_codon:yes stop_codon:yes gene_type:complete